MKNPKLKKKGDILTAQEHNDIAQNVANIVSDFGEFEDGNKNQLSDILNQIRKPEIIKINNSNDINKLTLESKVFKRADKLIDGNTYYFSISQSTDSFVEMRLKNDRFITCKYFGQGIFNHFSEEVNLKTGAVYIAKYNEAYNRFEISIFSVSIEEEKERNELKNKQTTLENEFKTAKEQMTNQYNQLKAHMDTIVHNMVISKMNNLQTYTWYKSVDFKKIDIVNSKTSADSSSDILVNTEFDYIDLIKDLVSECEGIDKLKALILTPQGKSELDNIYSRFHTEFSKAIIEYELELNFKKDKNIWCRTGMVDSLYNEDQKAQIKQLDTIDSKNILTVDNMDFKNGSENVECKELDYDVHKYIDDHYISVYNSGSGSDSHSHYFKDHYRGGYNEYGSYGRYADVNYDYHSTNTSSVRIGFGLSYAMWFHKYNGAYILKSKQNKTQSFTSEFLNLKGFYPGTEGRTDLPVGVDKATVTMDLLWNGEIINENFKEFEYTNSNNDFNINNTITELTETIKPSVNRELKYDKYRVLEQDQEEKEYMYLDKSKSTSLGNFFYLRLQPHRYSLSNKNTIPVNKQQITITPNHTKPINDLTEINYRNQHKNKADFSNSKVKYTVKIKLEMESLRRKLYEEQIKAIEEKIKVMPNINPLNLQRFKEYQQENYFKKNPDSTENTMTLWKDILGKLKLKLRFNDPFFINKMHKAFKDIEVRL